MERHFIDLLWVDFSDFLLTPKLSINLAGHWPCLAQPPALYAPAKLLPSARPTLSSSNTCNSILPLYTVSRRECFSYCFHCHNSFPSRSILNITSYMNSLLIFIGYQKIICTTCEHVYYSKSTIYFYSYLILPHEIL